MSIDEIIKDVPKDKIYYRTDNGVLIHGDCLEILSLLTEKSIKGSIYGSANPAVDFPKLISLWEQGRLDLETLVGKMRPFSEINEGIAEMRSGKVTRVVLTF